MKKLEKKQIIILVCVLALLLLIGGTYAYFSINASNDQTGAKVTGSATKEGNPTMQTMTKHLFLNLDASLMSQANAGKTYYANSDESGLALTTNPNYTLAIADLPEGDEILDCTYNYKVTATVQTAITDGSDADVNVVVGDRTLTLKEITDAGDTGIVVSGEFRNLVAGTSQRIGISSSVTNTSKVQDSLVGNIYTIKVEPYNNGDTKAFSCKLHKSNPTIAKYLVDSGNLFQTNLENDGYRYVGTNPNNYICFGTDSMSDCVANHEKYMYRIIGVFADSNGDNHVKLIKEIQLQNYSWNTSTSNTTWANSSLYSNLNGSVFLNNTTYIPNATWNSKIENWTWSAVDTQYYSSGGKGPQYDVNVKPTDMYLHEMNRSTKTNTVGNWTTPSAKIGLMYASDFALSLGNTSLSITSSVSDNQSTFATSWLNPANRNSENTYNEWTIAYSGASRINASISYYAYAIGWNTPGDGGGRLDGYNISLSEMAASPVFYLTSDTKISAGGDGSLANPFMLE